MPASTSNRFTGFSPALFEFLSDLADNNDRQWFARHKARYEAAVREPALAFIAAAAPALRRISNHFVASDAKVGGSLMRIHRDVRFSSDKSPYKTNVGIQFRHRAGKDVHAPGFYLHLEPGEIFIGVGLWHPEPEALAAIRRRIVDAPGLWKKARHDPAFAAAFELGGESLRRPPRGIDPQHPYVEDLKRKDHIAVCKLSFADVTGKRALDTVMQRFAIPKRYMSFLCTALELPW